THIFAGPSDARFVWKKNGQKVGVCVNEQSHTLADGRVHVLSWVKDAVAENSEYHCSITSKAGNKTSKVLIAVEGKDSIGHNGWIKEYNSWRSAVSEHNTMMQNWKTTWESC
uniref:Ig-like domain-containing protein n=1 Tax=Pelusios castaneus TaxID=367368 RepID=A0A8C8RZW2_9SAUR